MTTEYTIDVKTENKTLGRIATQAATILRGKNTPQFTPNVAPDVKVMITNASSLELSPKRLEELYLRYSGYPGGQKASTKAKVIAKHGYSEIFRKAVYGMLPKNKLRDQMMKNLIVTE